MMSLSFMLSSLYKIKKLLKQLLVAVYKLLYLLAEYGVGKLRCRGTALVHEILGVSECVFDIE